METDTRVPQPDVVESDPPLNGADAARSEENILQWMSYLPEDCVRTMIDMGWDLTT